MKQFITILNFELKYYLRNKIFGSITLFIILLIALITSFPRISQILESDNANISPTVSGTMLIKVDDTKYVEVIKHNFAIAFDAYDVQITTDDIASVQEQIISDKAECAFVISSPLSYTYYVNNHSIYDINTTIADETLKKLYQINAMVDKGITAEHSKQIMNIPISGKIVSLGKDQVQNFYYTYIMIIALYLAILLYGQMVATNVASEKSSRTMELLITSSKSTNMMFGKVIASCLAGIFQLVSIFGSALIFYNFNKSYWNDNAIIQSIFNIPLDLLLYMLIFFILGFFIYAFLYGAIGATVSKLEDINTAVMPITILFIIAYLVVMFSLASGKIDNTLIFVCSFIPFTSPMSMFTRIAMSTVPWYEILTSIMILIGSVIGVGIIAAKIYRVGVLLYGTTPTVKSIIKSILRTERK